MEERLQKIMSQAGVCSRRAAETYLLAGRVTVNGIQAVLGDKADLERDRIEVDGMVLHRKETFTCLMLYKPRGYVTTLSDEKGRRNVADLVKECGTRVWPVGRLDFDSEGLLLMTDQGELTHRLTHPGHEVEKEYLTWVTGDAAGAIPILTAPMTVDGYELYPAKVKMIGEEKGQAILSVVIHEGKNRQVRRMCAQAGLEVRRLKRIREGNLKLDETMRPGDWRYLTEEELLWLNH